ncbi:MAG: thioesterase family protein [Acidimicrobiia bacterium]|nr:thioesterase family protein [Acidimicrobiia bacterium]
MNLWLRLVRVWLGTRRRPPLGAGGTSIIRMRAWPHDLDVWGHVNGGRYLTLSDLGRLHFFIRSGLARVARQERWVLPMAVASVRFRRPWRLGRTCELHTRILGWDDTWAFMSTEFRRGGKSVALVVTKGVVQDRSRAKVPTADVLARLGLSGETLPVPAEVETWAQAESVLTP